MKFVFLIILLAGLPTALTAQSTAGALQALEQRKTALLIQQTTEIGRYLKEQQALYMKRGDLESANALQSLLDEATRRYAALQSGNTALSPKLDDSAQFVERLKNLVWDLPTQKNPHYTVRILGETILWRDDSGADKFILKYTVAWPGLLRAAYTDGRVAYYAFSQDLSKLWIMTATAEFPGALLQKP